MPRGSSFSPRCANGVVGASQLVSEFEDKPASEKRHRDVGSVESVLSGPGPEEEDTPDQTVRFPSGLANVLSQHGQAFPNQPTGTRLSDAGGRVESRTGGLLRDEVLVTAFQPVYDLTSGAVVGAQALTRFVSAGAREVADWFAQARDEQVGSDLEFWALESALDAARELPTDLYVALKLSPATCLDPLLPGLLEESALDPTRLVLELTEAMTKEQPAELLTVLAPLRRSGVRLAVDHAGSYFTSIQHIRQLRPDVIKLDRNLVAGIDADPLRSSLAEAMIGFAHHLGAVVTAQGIETPEELSAVTALGATAGQGYLLGRPTTSSGDWKSWTATRRMSPE